MRMFKWLPVVAIVATACSSDSLSSTTEPTGSQTKTPNPTPTPTPTPTEPVLAMFRDPASSFSTWDVREVQDQVVQFDTVSNSLIWATDGRRFTGYPVVDAYFIRSDKNFQIRFGTKNGERR